MIAISFTDDVRTEVHEAAAARGYTADIVNGCLASIARDIGRDFDSLIFRPPDRPDRRTYQKMVEALGLVEAVCEERRDGVVVIRLRVEAFD